MQCSENIHRFRLLVAASAIILSATGIFLLTVSWKRAKILMRDVTPVPFAYVEPENPEDFSKSVGEPEQEADKIGESERMDGRRLLKSSTDLACESITAKRVSTLDMRNPSSMKIAETAWEQSGKLVRLTILENMVKADTRECTEWLLRIINCTDEHGCLTEIGIHAVASLGRMKNQLAVKEFYSLECRKEESVRLAYASALAYIQGEKATHALVRLLTLDNSDRVKKQAQTSLVRKR